MSQLRRIAVVSTARSDFGIYRPVLKAIEQSDALELLLVAGGLHLSPQHGLTIREIESEGFVPAGRVDCLLSADTPEGVAKSMGLALIGFAQTFADLRPDLVLVLGDRFEMFAAASAAVPFNLPIAHIHGGETSFGAIDDSFRHAITKLSHVHFPSTETYANRIRRMSEEAWRVHVVGAPALDNLRQLQLPDLAEVAKRFDLDLSAEDPLVVCTFHPETRCELEPERQIDTLLTALDGIDRPILFTIPNADVGGYVIRRNIEAFCAARPTAQLTENLGTANYFAVLSKASAMVGNSSSGIIEAASFGLPVVDVGDRQAGRAHGANVLHAELEPSAIRAALDVALSDDFQAEARQIENIYGDGRAAERIVAILEQLVLDTKLVAKRFE